MGYYRGTCKRCYVRPLGSRRPSLGLSLSRAEAPTRTRTRVSSVPLCAAGLSSRPFFAPALPRSRAQGRRAPPAEWSAPRLRARRGPVCSRVGGSWVGPAPPLSPAAVVRRRRSALLSTKKGHASGPDRRGRAGPTESRAGASEETVEAAGGGCSGGRAGGKTGRRKAAESGAVRGPKPAAPGSVTLWRRAPARTRRRRRRWRRAGAADGCEWA